MYRERKLAVVVPAFNESQLIGKVVSGIPEYVDEIVIVDDGSSDGTSSVAALSHSGASSLKVIQHDFNRGVGAAIDSGYRYCLSRGHDLVAVMAGDDQMDPCHLPSLLDPIIEGEADYAKGNRLSTRGNTVGMSVWRRLGNVALSTMTKMATGYWHIGDSQNGFTGISRSALERLMMTPLFPYYGYCNDVLVRLSASGARVVDVPIPARYGNEVSKIRYTEFVCRVGPMITRAFFHRLKEKHRRRDTSECVVSLK